MDDLTKEIAKWLIQSYPLLLTIVGFVIIFLYIIKEVKIIFFMKGTEDETFGKKILKFLMFWRNWKKGNTTEPKNVHYTDEERERVVNKLLIHNLFIAINNMKTQIPSMEFGYQRKSEVLRSIIKTYIETIEKYANHVLKSNKLDELTTNQLNELLIGEIDRAHYEIYSKMKTNLGDALYQKIIEDPVKGFKVRNNIFREVFVNGILLISSQAMSVYNYDNYERASEILTSMYISLQVIVRNFEKVFKDYNGELDKYLL
jgi:hypothetical protein